MKTSRILLHGLLGLSFLAPVNAAAQQQDTEREERTVLKDLKLPKLRTKKKKSAQQVEEATFKIVKGDGRLYFSLVVGEDVLLRSPGYATERAVNEAIDQVKERIRRLRDMPLRRLKTGEYYFIVTTQKDDVLASSPLYASAEEARTMRIRLKDVKVASDKT